MAMAAESLCHNDPNFAVICNFWDRYGEMIGLKEISYSDLERWLEDTKQVPMPLIDIHVRLLRRIGKTSVTANRWERYIIKFCYTYSDVDAWEIEKFGYKHSKLPTKLKLLKNLLEKQFDQNSTFKEKVNKLAPEDMRFQPIGRDKDGLAYWYMLDNECNLRVYREDLDDNDAETWEIVCKTRSDLAELIGQLEKQIEGGGEVKEEPLPSNSNSVKSEPADDDEKKLGTSDDSRDSLPDVKKDPEKIKSNADKHDEVDGVVIDSKEGDEKKDVNIEKCQNDRNKDIKIEKCGDDEKKENKFEKCDSDKKKDSKDEKCDNDAKKDVKVENIKSEIKNDVKKEDNHSEEKKDDDAVATSELTVKNLKTEPVDDTINKISDVKSEIKNSAAECEKEGAKSNVLPENICKSEEDSQKENVKKDSCTKLSKMSMSNDKSKETTQSHCNKDTTESIPKTDTSVEDKDKIPEKNLDSQNDKSDYIIKTECLEKDEASESIRNEIILKIDDNCLKKNKSDSSTKSENVSDTNDTKNREEIITNSDNKSATSNLNGAKCDTNDEKLRSSDLTEEDVKCGCDNEGETNTKGDNQGNLKNNSVVVKEIDDNKSENNVRRSSRARTARTQSQDSQLKEGKCEKETQKTCSVENNQHSEKDSDKQTNLNGNMEKENNKTPSKNRSKDKGKKRPLLFEDNSTEDSPTVEPESKKSKQARKILTKKSPVKVKSSSDDTDDSDDIPLSQIKGTPKSSGEKTPNRTPKGKKGKNSKPTPTRKSSRPVKKKKFDSDEEEAETLSKSKKAKGKMEGSTKDKSAQSDDEETPLKSSKKLTEEVINEEDNGGRRRSSRVKILKAKKKEPTPPPSSFSEEEKGEDDGDHSEFSIETDLDDSDDEYNPTPKGRNAQRQAAIQDVQEQTVEIPNDTPCLHCHQTDRPEWLLLCDKCDDGYHTACLRPPLMIVPDGDWFCPPCEHKGLLERLQSSLKDLDIIMKKKDRLIKRKERLAFVGISLDNILKDEHKENVNPADYDQCSGEDYDEEYYKPKSKKGFVKRSCRSRNVISYKFDEFDDMINTAIKEDLENPQPYNPGKGRSRGKDMANIYMAEGREYVSEDEGRPSPVGGGKKKKGRRLTNLDSDDPADEDSGDEYKCSDDTISEPPEEEEEDEDISDYSADGERWRPKGTRRSARRNKTCRRYRDFVVDEDEDSDFAPRRKSARATRASTRQRRKYKDVWSDEEEEELEEETEESVDTEDLCSEDSGPTKKKKNRREIDKKVLGRKKKDKKKDEHSAKRRRIVDSEEGSESSGKSSGNGDESESKSESDDSSVDMGKIKKAAKRKLSKRRYSESSSESEKSDSEPSRHTRRSAAKKINYKAIAGTDSEATEVSEDKSESEEDKMSKKKNVIRDDSTDTDDYYDKKENNKEGDTTEEDEKQQTKPNKQKDEKESDTEPSDGRESPVKEVNEKIPLVLKDDDSNKPQDIDSESKSEEGVRDVDSESKSEEGVRDVDLSSQDSVNSRENCGQRLTSQSQSENAAQNLSMLQNSTGVIRPCPQYSMGQNIPEGNFPPQYGSQQFQGRSPPYGSPPHRQYMSSPPHQSYHSQAGHVMRPGQPHSQPYPPSQQYPPQAMHGNFPVSSSGQPMTQMSSSQGPVSSPPFSTMQQRPQYSSGGPIPQSQDQMFGRSVQGQPVIRGPPPGQQDGSQMQKGQRPEMSGPPGGPFPHQQDGQMMRGPFPNQPQLMHGPYQNQQQMMMMQGQYSNYQQGQMMRGPHPGQQGGQMMRGPYPNPSPQDIPRGPHPNQDGTMKGQHPGQQGSSIRSPDPANSHTGHSERPMMQAPYPGYPPRHMMRGPYPGQSERNMFRGQSERPMMRGQDGPFRPGFSTPGQVIQGPHPNQQEFTNRPPHPVFQMTHSHPQMSGLQVTSPPMSSPPMSSPPIIPSAAKDQIHSDQEKNVIAVKKENIEAKVQGENQKDSSVIKDLSTLQKHQTENEPVSKQDKAISLKQEDKKTDIKSNLCESDNKMASVDNEASDDVSKETTQKEAKENKDDSNEKDDKKKINEEDKQSSVSSEPENSDKKSDLSKKPDGETVAELLSQKDETKQSLENKGEKMTSNEKLGKEVLSESQFTQQRVPNLQSPPPQNQSEGQISRGPVSSQQESSMVRGPHPYHQGMFRGQFNEMMSQMGQPRMQFQQGPMDMSNIPNMQGPQNFNQMGSGPRNFMPGMRPEPMGPMQPNFQRPMYGPGSNPYSQPQRMPNSYGPRPEMGLRMPQSYEPEDNRPEVQNKSKMAEGGPPQSGSEQTKTKKPRKPRQTKQQKLQAESKTAVSSSANYPGITQPPHQMTSNPQYQMPMPRPMNPQQGPYVRPPFDNYGMNGMNQGPPEYNQMNPGMYGPPQMMAGNRAFMIDNLLDKQPRVQQLEPIISQDDEDEAEPERPPSFQEETSPSNGEKDMDEMSDIGDIVKYVMNH